MLKNRNLNAYINYQSVSKPVEVHIWPSFLKRSRTPLPHLIIQGLDFLILHRHLEETKQMTVNWLSD